MIHLFYSVAWSVGEGGEIHADDTRLVYCFVPVQMQTQILKRSVSDPGDRPLFCTLCTSPFSKQKYLQYSS